MLLLSESVSHRKDFTCVIRPESEKFALSKEFSSILLLFLIDSELVESGSSFSILGVEHQVGANVLMFSSFGSIRVFCSIGISILSEVIRQKSSDSVILEFCKYDPPAK